MVKIEKLKTIQKRPINVLVYGNPGVGKTTFGATAPRPLFVDLERGAIGKSLEQYDLSVVQVDKISQLGEVYLMAKKGELADFDTIVIDSISEVMKQLQEEYAKTDPKDPNSKKITQNDWGKIISRAENIVRQFVNLPTHHVIFIAKEAEVSTDDETYIRPSVSGKKFPSDLSGYMDIVGRLVSWQVGKSETKRALIVHPDEKFYAKDRFGVLPRNVEPDFTKLYSLVCEGMGWEAGEPKATPDKSVKSKEEPNPYNEVLMPKVDDDEEIPFDAPQED